jgi:hypothetical protein
MEVIATQKEKAARVEKAVMRQERKGKAEPEILQAWMA